MLVDTEINEQFDAAETVMPAQCPHTGQNRLVGLGPVVTRSPNLHTKQAAGFEQTLAKTTPALTELAATLARGKTRRQAPAVQAAIATITSARWVNRVLTTTLTGTKPADLRLTWRIDPRSPANSGNRDLRQTAPGHRPAPLAHRRAQRILTDTDPTQKRLISVFDLTKYAPKR